MSEKARATIVFQVIAVTQQDAPLADVFLLYLPDGRYCLSGYFHETATTPLVHMFESAHTAHTFLSHAISKRCHQLVELRTYRLDEIDVDHLDHDELKVRAGKRQFVCKAYMPMDDVLPALRGLRTWTRTA